MADNTVRELHDVDLGVIVTMAGFCGFSRVMRELLIREKLLSDEAKKAETSRDFQDCAMGLEKVHVAIGKVVSSWWQSKSRDERWKLGITSMTTQEKATLLKTLTEDIGEEQEPHNA